MFKTINGVTYELLTDAILVVVNSNPIAAITSGDISWDMDLIIQGHDPVTEGWGDGNGNIIRDLIEAYKGGESG